MVIRRLASVFLIVGLAGCSSPAPAPTAPASPGSTAERKYLLDRVDDAAIVQLYADGFTALPLKQKTLIWHLYQAALAGRDIFIDQKHKDALEMREVIEQIIAYPQGVDAATLSAIQRYAKLFWLNNGPYNNLTARKFVLTCTPDAAQGRGLRVGEGRREVHDLGEDDRSEAGASRADVLRSRTSIRSSPTRRPAPARTSSRRARTIFTPACRWRT